MSEYVVKEFLGMNDWKDPGLLDPNTAVMLKNADITSGKLSGIKLPRRLNFTDPVQLGHFGKPGRSVVKWYDRYYWSNNEAWSSPYYGGNIEGLGVAYPSANPTLSSESPVGSGLSGTYKYCWTYVNRNGWESAPCAEDGALWSEITVSGKKICVTAPGSFPSGISYMKVYRTGDKGADFYCVGKISTAGGKLYDETPDVTLVMLEAASSFDNYPPPAGGKYLTESGGVFFLGVGSKLYFSIQNNPHAWPTLNFIGIGDTITGIVPEFQGVLVFTKNNTYRITGADSQETITKSMIPGNQGCLKYRTISQVSNAPIWLSNDGICLWDGQNIQVVSRDVIRTEKLQVRYGVGGNDVYYLFLEDGAILYDKRSGGVFRRLSFTSEYGWYNDDADILYLVIDGYVHEFGAGAKGRYYYKSPYIGGGELSFKSFHEIVLSFTGDIMVTVETDGAEKFAVELYGGGRRRVKFPYSSVARYVQVSLDGSDELSEYAVLWN